MALRPWPPSISPAMPATVSGSMPNWPGAHQRLARQLQQDAVEARAGHAGSSVIGARYAKRGGCALTTHPPRCQPHLTRSRRFRRPARPCWTPAAAATSAAKSLSAFSMPSPSWKRSKAFSAIGEPASLPAGGDDVGDRGLVVDHEQLAEQRILLAELGHRAVDHLLDDVGRLAALGRLFDRDRALALEQRRRRGRRRRAPAGWRRRCASRAACRARSSASAGAALSSATSTPILPMFGAAALWT